MDPSKTALKLSWMVAAILALLPFHALFTTWAGSNFGHLDAWRVWKEILLLLAIPPILWLIWRAPELRKWLKQSWIARLFGLYVVLHLLLGTWALAQNEVNATAFIYSLIVSLRFIGFFLLCAVIVSQNDFLRRHWQKLLLLPAAAIIIFGLIQKFLLPYDFLRHFGYGKDTIVAYQTVDSNLDYRRIQSSLRGANPLGAYLVLIIPAFWLSLQKTRVWRWLGLLGGLVVLLFSYSRSAWLGLVAAVASLRGVTLKTFNFSYRTIIVVLLLLALLGGGFFLTNKSDDAQRTIFHTSDESVASSSSNADRLASMKAGTKDIIRQPLGHGPGTAGPASFRNDQPARISENYFLQIGQEVGIAGIAIFVAICVLVGRELWRHRSEQLAKILLASLVGITFVNLLSHAWTDDTLAYLWWGMAGICLAPRLVKDKH